MPYDFTLMRFPRPTPPGLEAPEPGPQAILRPQIRQVLDEMAGLRVADAGRLYTADLPTGQHLAIHIDPVEPPQYLTVEFDRYDSPADYAAVRGVVDQICEGLRLTIADDPDAGANLGGEIASGGGLLDRLRGLFGR